MQPDEFIRTRPCLDELEGYMFGIKAQGITLSGDDLVRLEEYRKELMKGTMMPARTMLNGQMWQYRHRKPPIKRKTPYEYRERNTP